MKDSSSSDKRLASIPWDEVESLRFPTWFTAVIDYFATGEGLSQWIVMGQARSADDLRCRVLKYAESYFAEGASIWPTLHVPAEVRDAVPVSVQAICSLPDEKIGTFEYAGRFHRNLA